MTYILVIEDIPDNWELVRRALTSRGYEVVRAEDAQSGYDLALSRPPDLILLDLGLPDYDGLTLVGHLREHAAFETIPIIAFTAWPPDTARAMAENYGCNGFIPKPIIRVNDFLAQVENFLPKEKIA